jgi:beta-xylosidase
MSGFVRRDFLKGAAAVGAGGAVVARRPRSRSTAQAAQAAGPSPDAPLFGDPIFDGASDPTVIYNRDTSEWWMFSTARRANVSTPGVGWVHGSDVGIATSTNGGRSWLYRGTAEGLAFEPGRNTYWAPEVIEDRGTYHMYVSFVRGVPSVFGGERHILHYRSKDLWNWRLLARLDLSSDRVIDACVWPLPDGRTWRMWFKDEADGSHIYAADSHDLSAWKVMGRAFASGGQEGPNVFRFAGS